jgi:4-amino-4-deoxy-L-arabinose transferase-like glycosyltransferase
MDAWTVVLGHFLASFISALAIAGIWVAICRFVPALRRKPMASRVAVVLAFVPILITADGLRNIDLVACLLAAGLVYWYVKGASAGSKSGEPHASA